MTTKMKSVFTAAMVAFAGAFAFSAAAASVCKIGDEEYSSVSEAVQAAEQMKSAKIEMLSDAPVTESVSSSAGNITLDLAGFTITSTAEGPAFRITGGSVTFTNSVGEGKIVAKGYCVEVQAKENEAAPVVSIVGGTYASETNKTIVSTASGNVALPGSVVTAGTFDCEIAPYLVKPTSICEKLAPGVFRVRPDWLCLTAVAKNSTVTMQKNGEPDPISLEYSLNGENWFPFVFGTTTITLASVGDHVFFRGDNETFSKGTYDYYGFALTGTIAASGNVMSLLSKDCTKTDVPAYAFAYLFNGSGSNNTLVSAPKLPATELSEGCYYCMFAGNLALITAPVLPARTIPSKAYGNMFYTCKKLGSAVVLADKFEENAASGMFGGSGGVFSNICCRATSINNSRWLSIAAANGVYNCPFELDDSVRGVNTIPAGWEVKRPEYLSFTARNAAVSVSLKRVGNPEDFELEYASSPTSADWAEYIPGKSEPIEIAADTTVYLRRKDSARFDSLNLSTKDYWQFEMTGDGEVWANGRLTSLITKYGFNETVGDYGFFRLFAGCKQLVSSPIIPEDISGKQCCQSLFEGCSNLKRVSVAFTKFGDTTVNWLKGVAENGIFIRPDTLKVTSKTANTVPYAWTVADTTSAVIPNEIENATYVVKNGAGEELIPTYTGYNATNSVYLLGRKAEDLVVELTAAPGYTYDEAATFRINASELTEASYDLAALIPQAKLAIAQIEGKERLYSSLDYAVYAAEDNDTVNLLRSTDAVTTNVGAKTVTINCATTNLISGEVVATKGVLYLENAYMSSKLIASDVGKIIFLNGTNTYADVFKGSVVLTNGVFGYKHDDSFIRDGDGAYTMARIGATKLWTIVTNDDLVAEVRGEKFTSFEAAMEYAEDGDVIKFLKDYDQDIAVANMTLVFDVNGKVFSKELKPQAGYNVAMNNSYQLYFTQEPLVAKIDPKVQGGEMAFTNHQQALDTALNGQKILFLAPTTGDLKIDGAKTNTLDFAANIHSGKLSAENGGRIIVAGGTNTYAATFSGDVVLNAGTYSYNQIEFVGEGKSMANNGDGTWTVVKEGDIVAEFKDTNPLERFTSLAVANKMANDGETLMMVNSHYEDITFTKQLTFVHTNDLGNCWSGTLTADGKAISVIGTRGIEGNCKFAVANDGNVVFDYSPSQKAVADAENYAIVRIGNGTAFDWQLMTKDKVVAEDANDADELFKEVQIAADVCSSIKITAKNEEQVTAKHDFTMTVVGDLIWDGTVDHADYTVTALNGSKFSKDPTNAIEPESQHMFAHHLEPSEIWEVVPAGEVVASITREGKTQNFTSLDNAVTWAKKGETVVFLRDLTENVNNPEALCSKDLRIDLAGHKWDGTFTGIPTSRVAMERVGDTWLLYLLPAAGPAPIVAEIQPRLAEEKVMQFTNLQQAVTAALDGQTVRLLQTVDEDIVISDKTITLDMIKENYTDGTKKYNGQLNGTLKYTSSGKTLTLTNLDMTVKGKLIANDSYGKIVVVNGQNLYHGAFDSIYYYNDKMSCQTNIYLKSGVYGYEHYECQLDNGMIFANLASSTEYAKNTWKIAPDTTVLATITRDGNVQKFVDFQQAMEWAQNGETVEFYQNYNENIAMKQAYLDKNLKFDVKGYEFMGEIKPENASYNVAMNVDHQLYTTTETIVAKITAQPQGGVMQFTKLQTAVDAALDGQTVMLVKNIEGDLLEKSITVGDKNLTLDMFDTVNNKQRVLDGAIVYQGKGGNTLTIDNMKMTANGSISADSDGKIVVMDGVNEYAQAFEGDINLKGGTYSYNQIAFVRDEDKTMRNNGDGTWTVVPVEDIVAEFNASERFTSLEDANKAAKGGETLTMVNSHTEDIIFTKAITFVFNSETYPDAEWFGTLTADAEICVKGFRAENTADRKYAYTDKGAVYFDHNPSQAAVKDEGYAIIHMTDGKPYDWQLRPASEVVAKDMSSADKENEFFKELADAAKFCDKGGEYPWFEIVKATGENISVKNAGRSFTMSTAADVIYNGELTNCDKSKYSVQTKLGSRYQNNLIDEFDWSKNQLTLEWNGTCYEVVAESDIVAQFVSAEGKTLARFTNAVEAVNAIGKFTPFAEFQIGVNDSIETYAFNGIRKCAASFADLVSLGGVNTIQNLILEGEYCVKGDAGTVIFDQGVRLPASDEFKAFKSGNVELKVVKGAYWYDPTPFCEDGYSATRRYAPIGELTGYYVVYANTESQVTVTEADGHNVHYKTLQDAFDLAPNATPTQIALFNNGEINASVPVNKSFVLTQDPNGAAQTGAYLITNSTITVEGNLLVTNLTLKSTKFVVKSTGALGIVDVDSLDGEITVEAGGKLYVAEDEFTGGQIVVNGAMEAGDGFVMSGATDGAVIVKDGGQFILNGSAKIYDNNGKNVVIENALTGFVLKDRGTYATGSARVGITCANGCEAGQQFGTVSTEFRHELFAEGDITGDNSGAAIFNDLATDLRYGKGAKIVGPAHADVNSYRFVKNYTEVIGEGKDLIVREGNELVWLAVPEAEEAEIPLTVVGRTADTVTIEVGRNYAAEGRDYAVVYDDEDINFCWESITANDHGVTRDGRIEWNGKYQLTLKNLRRGKEFTLYTRTSITEDSTVSATKECEGIPCYTGNYNALQIAGMFFGTKNVAWIDEANDIAGNDHYIVVKPATDGDGYVVTLFDDLDRGADLADDMGHIVLNLNTKYLNASGVDQGITFKAGSNYGEGVFATHLEIVNSRAEQDMTGRVVGARGADGTSMADATDGQPGINNKSNKLVYVTIGGNVEVFGGNGGNGFDCVNSDGYDGANGGNAIVGRISLTLDGGSLFGGHGGNGGVSTYAVGGNGGNGGAAIGDDVVGTILSGKVIGGNGGNAGGGKQGAGKGGNGGDGFVNVNTIVVQGDYFTDQILIEGGKGGQSTEEEKCGEDGKAGKPAAPAAPIVKGFHTEDDTVIVTLTNVFVGCQYYCFKTELGPKTPVWTDVTEEMGGKLEFTGLTKNTGYTVWTRVPAKRDESGQFIEQESFYSAMKFTTIGYTADDFVQLFNGKVEYSYDEEDGVTLTMNANITRGIELPDNLGTFKLAMRGYCITGRNGVEDDAPDGESAITFVQRGGTEETRTVMTITGNGKNAITGGNGAENWDADEGDGIDGGNGGSGIQADGLATLCKVILVKGTIRGGNGGEGSSSTSGTAGNGGDGGDAVVVEGEFAVEFEYVGGETFGGEGGRGGDTYDGQAGNGGKGGDAFEGEGGCGGAAGEATNGDFEKFGQPGEGGKGRIPGGFAKDYLMMVVPADGDPTAKPKFYYDFPSAFDNLEKGQTVTVIRDCTFDSDDYVQVLVDDIKLSCAFGAKLTWNGEIEVGSDIRFTILTNFEANVEQSAGFITVNGEVFQKGGYVPNVTVNEDGVFYALAGKVGYVNVAEKNGRFVVPGITEAKVEKGINATDKMDVFLFGGTYGFDPSEYVRAPYEVSGSDPWIVQPDKTYVAMAVIDRQVTALETLDAAFDFMWNKKSVEVYLLQDCEATKVYSDRATTNVKIYGFGHKITDVRTGVATESALFNLAGNLSCFDVTFDGAGTQAGQFVRVFDKAQVTFAKSTVTGYACWSNVAGNQPLISGSSAGESTSLTLIDTAITGNDVSCAIDTTDTTDAQFRYVVKVGGATTICDNGGYGIYSDGYGQIVMVDDLCGGHIDVYYGGYTTDRKFAKVIPFDTEKKAAELTGADHFRYTQEKFCGTIVTEGDATYVRWMDDDRQYAAKVISADGAETNRYATIYAAFDSVTNGCTMVVLNDVTIDKSYLVELENGSDAFTLDLDGKTIVNASSKLKFGKGTVTIKNGTLDATSKYALYVYGGTVYLGENTRVNGNVYVARGNLKVNEKTVAVIGTILATNRGTVLLTGGYYAENPTAFVAGGYAAYADDTVPGCAWRVDDEVLVTGFADGFQPDADFNGNGEVVLDFSTAAAVGKIYEGATISYVGNVTDKITVFDALGWIHHIEYIAATDKTVVTFTMDEQRCKLIYGNSDDPGDRPFEITERKDGKIEVTFRVMNAIRGFWYQIVKTSDLQTWYVITSKQATENGNLEVTIVTEKQPSEGEFFRATYADREQKVGTEIDKADLKY